MHGRGRVGHMPKRRRYSLYGVSLAVWLTGAVWLIFHYFVKQVDNFGFEAPHPAEKWSLIVHAGFSFYVLWWFGMLWPNHIKKSWKTHVRRGTGGTLFGFAAWLTLTGYALYYLGSDVWRSWVSVLHWAVGLGALVAFMLHLLTRTPRTE